MELFWQPPLSVQKHYTGAYQYAQVGGFVDTLLRHTCLIMALWLKISKVALIEVNSSDVDCNQL